MRALPSAQLLLYYLDDNETAQLGARTTTLMFCCWFIGQDSAETLTSVMTRRLAAGGHVGRLPWRRRRYASCGRRDESKPTTANEVECTPWTRRSIDYAGFYPSPSPHHQQARSQRSRPGWPRSRLFARRTTTSSCSRILWGRWTVPSLVLRPHSFQHITAAQYRSVTPNTSPDCARWVFLCPRINHLSDLTTVIQPRSSSSHTASLTSNNNNNNNNVVSVMNS